MTMSPLGLSVVVGFGAALEDGTGLLVLDLLVPKGLPVYFVGGGLLGAGTVKLADGFGITTTGGGSGIATIEAEGAATGSGGSMFDCTTKKATPPSAKTRISMTNPSVFRLREPSSSGGGEIRSPLDIPGAVVGDAADVNTAAGGAGATGTFGAAGAGASMSG